MTRHRELAQVVYGQTLGRVSASRIWRTVVVAGAMLGAPALASADDPPPAQKAPTTASKQAPAPSPPPPPPPIDKAAQARITAERVTALEQQLAALEQRIKDQQQQRTTLLATLKTARADAKKADAEAKKAEPKKPEPKPELGTFGTGRVRNGVGSGTRPAGRGFILS